MQYSFRRFHGFGGVASCSIKSCVAQCGNHSISPQSPQLIGSAAEHGTDLSGWATYAASSFPCHWLALVEATARGGLARPRRSNSTQHALAPVQDRKAAMPQPTGRSFPHLLDNFSSPHMLHCTSLARESVGPKMGFSPTMFPQFSRKINLHLCLWHAVHCDVFFTSQRNK